MVWRGEPQSFTKVMLHGRRHEWAKAGLGHQGAAHRQPSGPVRRRGQNESGRCQRLHIRTGIRTRARQQHLWLSHGVSAARGSGPISHA